MMLLGGLCVMIGVCERGKPPHPERGEGKEGGIACGIKGDGVRTTIQ